MRFVVPLVLVLGLVACGNEDGGSVAGSGAATSPGPDEPTRVWAMVMDTGRPELCLGPVAESWPPQCSGPEIEGWDWSAYDGDFERHGDVRWGEFVLTGRWQGSTFEIIEAVPPVKGEPVTGLDPVPPDEVLDRLRTVVVDLEPDNR